MSDDPAPAAKPGPEVEPGAEIAHATKGRVRLKIPAAKRNPELLNQIRTAFSHLPGIDGIEIRPESGSLVIYYDPDHHPDIGSVFSGIATAPSAAVAPETAAATAAAATAAAEHAARRPPSNKLDEITRSIEDEAEFLAEHSNVAKTIVESVKQLDRHIKRATGNNIDLKILVPIGLAAVTVLEIGAAAATPMWVTLVIFSLNHFVELHAHDADGRENS